MPLQPIRFNTIDDVYKLLNKLRDKNLLSFADGGKVILSWNIELLKQQFIVASDHETYLLDDLFEMSDQEMFASNLSFITITRHDNQLSDPIALSTDRLKLRTYNTSLLHNLPLVNALLELNPSPGNLLNMSFSVTKTPIIFPVLTTSHEATAEGIDKALSIFSTTHIGPDEHGRRPLTVTCMLANTALLDLQRIHWNQLQTFMAQLSNDNAAATNDIRAVIVAKNQELEASLTRVQQLVDTFKTTHPACKTALTDNLACYRDNEELINQMQTYRRCEHLIPFYDEKVSDTTRYTIISAALFWTVLGSIVLAFNGHDLHRFKKLLAETQARFRGVAGAKEQFIQDQAMKVHMLIIQPYEALTASLKTMLTQPALAAAEKTVVPFESKSNSLQQFGLMAAQPQIASAPEPEAMQRFDRRVG